MDHPVDTLPPLRDLADQPFALLLEMERRAQRRYGSSAQTEQWVGVGLRVGDDQYVVPREQIREVMQRPSLTRIPGSQPWLLGLANVRGQLMPVVDLKVLCGDAPTPTERRTRVVLVNSDEVPMAVVVDEVFGFRRFAPDEQQAGEPATAEVGLADFVDGKFARDGVSWPILSFVKVIQSPKLLSAV
ncbi:MAG: chemotaxis protein CheW [Gammaproteobacteria bacterium]